MSADDHIKSYEQECIFKCEDLCTCKCMPSFINKFQELLQNLSLKDVLSNSFCVENREILDAVRAPVSQLEKIRKSDCFKLLWFSFFDTENELSCTVIYHLA